MIFLIVICICIICYEKKKWDSLSSPATLMSFSYLGAIICAITGNFLYGYHRISDNVCFLLSLSVFLFWMPNLFFKFKKERKEMIIPQKEKIVFSEYAFFLFSFSLAVLLSINLIREFSIGSNEFEENYSHGIVAHVRNILIVLFTYFLCFKKDNFINIAIKIVSFILIFISDTKYHIIFPFLIWFVFFLHRNKSLQRIVFLSFRASLIIFIIFSANYYIGFHLRGTFNDNFNFFDFAFNHFLTYVSGGFITFSEVLENNYIDIGIFHNTRNIPFDSFVSISSTNNSVSNVRGIFGFYLLSYGYLFTYTLFVILGFVFHYLYMVLSVSGNKYYFLAYGFFIASPMMLSFFASYYSLFAVWEYTFLSFMLPIIFLLINESMKSGKISQPQNLQITQRVYK